MTWLFCLLPYADNELTNWHLLSTWLVDHCLQKWNDKHSNKWEDWTEDFCYISSIFTLDLDWMVSASATNFYQPSYFVCKHIYLLLNFFSQSMFCRGPWSWWWVWRGWWSTSRGCSTCSRCTRSWLDLDGKQKCISARPKLKKGLRIYLCEKGRVKIVIAYFFLI